MLQDVLATMNASLRDLSAYNAQAGGDAPFTIEDARQHMMDYDRWCRRCDENAAHENYQKAKAAFDQFPWISSYRPDSLTRRGDVLIARRALSFGGDLEIAQQEWCELIEGLFEGVAIHRISIDRKRSLRVYFSFV